MVPVLVESHHLKRETSDLVTFVAQTAQFEVIALFGLESLATGNFREISAASCTLLLLHHQSRLLIWFCPPFLYRRGGFAPLPLQPRCE